MRRTALFAVLAAAVVAAQASSSSVAAASASREFAAGSPGPVAATVVRQWRADLRSAALAAPGEHFKNLSRSTVLDRRLRIQAARKHFAVVSVQLLRPRQLAPLVIVKAPDKHAFVAATPAILKAIDPKRSTGDDRTGWAYEGFLLEALDSHGVPFLVVFNHWRGPHAGGGQWASDPSLFPFAHG